MLVSAHRTALRFALLACVVVAIGGCDTTASVTFQVGCDPANAECTDPVLFDVDASQAQPPDSFKTSDDRVAEVSCGPMGQCPQAEDVEVTCEQGVCDPGPVGISVPLGGVVDFEQRSSELRDLFTEISRFEIQEIEYVIRSNTLTFGVDQVELHWGPAGASEVDPAMGVQLLGTIPPLGPGEAPSGPQLVNIDATGEAALSDHVSNEEPRVRFFVRTGTDIDPGDPWPRGQLDVFVRMRIRVEGKIAG